MAENAIVSDVFNSWSQLELHMHIKTDENGDCNAIVIRIEFHLLPIFNGKFNRILWLTWEFSFSAKCLLFNSRLNANFVYWNVVIETKPTSIFQISMWCVSKRKNSAIVFNVLFFLFDVIHIFQYRTSVGCHVSYCACLSCIVVELNTLSVAIWQLIDSLWRKHRLWPKQRHHHMIHVCLYACTCVFMCICTRALLLHSDFLNYKHELIHDKPVSHFQLFSIKNNKITDFFECIISNTILNLMIWLMYSKKLQSFQKAQSQVQSKLLQFIWNILAFRRSIFEFVLT